MDEVILSRIRQEAYEQGFQDGKVDGYNLAGTLMSSAKQERKKGKWVLAKDGWYCSLCELYPPLDCDPEEKGIPYCPWCGARMEQ